ncbi:hypothetical protein [Rhodococcus globerulus]|uniref:Uncharacterized protein n=1 Tax=Rhodococcus globerulus TaxID=33008 RepID=A0ABU4C5M0_RHOGO|nr:hypothetical protein [Rhodococcus globerulus]MDV6271653.1 hypothetical protein [Rhodococcus globerulus]
MVPVDDVAGLTVCRYDVQSSANATVLAGSQGLSAEASRRAVESAFAAPSAGACSQTATEVVAMRLVRPDGSGGGVFLAEANGCERFMVPGLTGYRAMPLEALALLEK